MNREGTMRWAASSELIPLAAAMLVVMAFAIPVLERVQTSRLPAQWKWQPPQRNAWNPYDCRFWCELPVEEFAM